MNYEVVTNKDLEKFTEEYCLNLIKQYEKFNFMIVNEESFNKEYDKVFDTIEYLTIYEQIDYHLLVIVNNLKMEDRIREFFPDFEHYPTNIIFEKGIIKNSIEGKYIVKK